MDLSKRINIISIIHTFMTYYDENSKKSSFFAEYSLVSKNSRRYIFLLLYFVHEYLWWGDERVLDKVK